MSRLWFCALTLAVLTIGVGARADVCPSGAPIAAIRDGSVPEGHRVVVTGTVAGRFPGSDRLNGFYVQQHSDVGPPDGMFVYVPGRGEDAVPRVGERVSISARVGSYRGRPQLEWVRDVRACGPGGADTTVLTLPARGSRLERLVATRVRVKGPLTVADNRTLKRWGTLGLAVGGRPFHPDTGIRLGRPAGVLLDDGSSAVSPSPTPYLDAHGTRRVGDTVTSVTAILAHRYGHWRLYPVTPVHFARTNPRPAAPPPPAGDLRLASFNLHNFFVTGDDRGPRTQAGRRRQRQRLAQVLSALGADVFALQELENRPGAMTALLGLLNRGDPGGPYTGAAGSAVIGDGVIRTAIVYRRARLTLEDVDILDQPVHNRAPIRAVFRTRAGHRFAVVAVHFKSKGGCPRGNPDPGPQGCWSGRRARQADSLARWLHSGDEAGGLPTFILGDLNSYAREKAPRRLEAAGYGDLLAARVPAAARYSYVYRGRSGYLDYAFANDAAAARVEAVRIWHINADEPAFAAGEGPWRSSDHDPVVVDIGDGHR